MTPQTPIAPVIIAEEPADAERYKVLSKQKSDMLNWVITEE